MSDIRIRRATVFIMTRIFIGVLIAIGVATTAAMMKTVTKEKGSDQLQREYDKESEENKAGE